MVTTAFEPDNYRITKNLLAPSLAVEHTPTHKEGVSA